MSDMTPQELVNAAKRAMSGAYAPYSGFSVGAALLTADGKVYTGVNIENASFSLTNCAERTALFTAVAAGERRFAALAVAGGKSNTVSGICPPCGACRQALAEFCPPDMKIYIATATGYDEYTLSRLLPESFGKEILTDEK